jgi:hypothetical protein
MQDRSFHIIKIKSLAEEGQKKILFHFEIIKTTAIFAAIRLATLPVRSAHPGEFSILGGSGFHFCLFKNQSCAV